MFNNTPYFLNRSNYHWIFGDGNDILFWEYYWMQGEYLSIKYPRLYSISKWNFFSINQFISMWKNGINERWLKDFESMGIIIERGT